MPEVRRLIVVQAPHFRNGVLRFSMEERELRIYHIVPKGTDVSKWNLPDPRRKMANAPVAEALEGQKGFVAANWKVEGGEVAPIPETGLSFGLKPQNGKSAILRYAKGLPGNFSLKLRFRHSGAFKFLVDGVSISFDYHWGKGWCLEGLDNNDGLERCDVTLAAHGRSYSVLDRPVDLEVYLIDDRIAFFYDGVRILQYGLPALNHEKGHTLSMETKGKNWIAFDLQYFGPVAKGDMPIWPHPVR